MADFDPESAGVAVAPQQTSGFDPETAGVPHRIPHDVTLRPSDEETRRKNRISDQKERERIIQQNLRPGVPLDPDAGLPASIRARVSFETNPDKQVELLAKQPGILGARKTKDGSNIIATIADENGKERDVLLHPKNSGITGGDVAGAAFPLAKAGVATAVSSTGLGLLPTAALLALSGAGTHAVGTGLSRASAGQDIDPKELALSSAKEGALNAALPLATAGGKAVLEGGANLLTRGGRGALEQAVIPAAERQGIPLSASMATGSPVLARAEKTAGLSKLAAQEQGALKAAKDRAVGLSGPAAVPTEADIASGVQPIFAQAEQSAKGGVNQGFSDAQKAAQLRIQTQLDSGLVPTNLTQSEAGNFIRSKVEAARDAFQTASKKNYGDLYAKANEEGLTIPTDGLTKLTKEIQAKDPHGAVAQIVPEVNRIFGLESSLTRGTPAKATGLLDANGRPIMEAAKPPAPVTLPQAIELRAVINDKIARGEAVGDIPGKYLKDLSASLTEAIDQGVKSGSPELQAAFQKARGAYAKDIGKFTSADVGKLFVNPESGAALGDNEVIPRLFSGQGNLDALQKFKAVLDPNDYKLLLRQGVQSLVDSAKRGSNIVDAESFLNKIGSLSPDMREEVLGPLAKPLQDSTKILARAQGSKNIPEDELLDALRASPGQASQLLEAAVQRESAYNQTYNSAIQKQLRDGVLGPRTMGNPDDFVKRFLSNASTTDVRQALTQIGAKSPQAVESLRARTLQNILDSSGARAPVGQQTTGTFQNLDAKKLLEFTTGSNREKYQAVLGKDGIQFLDDMATIAEAQAKREAAQASSGLPFTHGAAKEIAGAAGSSVRDIAGTAYNLAALIPRAILGNAQRSAAVRQFLSTGKIPSFGLPPVARGVILAAPEEVKAEQAVAQ